MRILFCLCCTVILKSPSCFFLPHFFQDLSIIFLLSLSFEALCRNKLPGVFGMCTATPTEPPRPKLQIATFSIRRFGSQSSPAVSLSMSNCFSSSAREPGCVATREWRECNSHTTTVTQEVQSCLVYPCGKFTLIPTHCPASPVYLTMALLRRFAT